MPAAPMFPDGGEAGRTLRAVDWSKSALGPFERWPLGLLAHVRAMLSTQQQMCIFWGPDLVNLYNDAFLPILGDKHPAAMGQPAAECWWEAWDLVGPQLRDVLSGRNAFHAEVLVPIARGGTVADAWFNYSYSPLFDDAGAVAGVLVICTEVTSEVLARVAAEASNRAKDEFLATVSHELRTPLTAILGWARILTDPRERAREDGRLERFDKGLAIIERNAAAQAKIIDDILDVSRIISGKLQLVVRPLDASAAIHGAVESIRPAATAKGIQLRVDVTLGDLGMQMMGDEGRLQQIFWNLLANAVKFTPRGGDVSVRAFVENADVHFVVADSGRGISQEFLPYVFDRFRQDDASTMRQHGGLGLGLAIVRHLVELHGGTAHARSEGSGQGATFEVILPIRAGLTTRQTSDSTPPAPASAPDFERKIRLDGTTVLVVDDQDDARALVAVVLEDAGARVLQARSVADALAVLETERITALVSDIGMPGTDGYALARYVRSMPPHRDVPALALTAFARAEERARAIESGFDDHLAKPVDPKALVATLDALIQTKAKR